MLKPIYTEWMDCGHRPSERPTSIPHLHINVLSFITLRFTIPRSSPTIIKNAIIQIEVSENTFLFAHNGRCRCRCASSKAVRIIKSLSIFSPQFIRFDRLCPVKTKLNRWILCCVLVVTGQPVPVFPVSSRTEFTFSPRFVAGSLFVAPFDLSFIPLQNCNLSFCDLRFSRHRSL